MKLRKLTIHNIASIEDAEIDFQKAPLADADVFLISGKTGSGKSTILDCICLALFTSTPRMDMTMMEGKMNDNTDKINVDNPRQLLRRGTGEGFARLSFTGNDGIDYEATWTASRAYNKPTGRLKKTLNWEIRNLTTGAITKSSEENKAIISRALGVDFNQFCRTTMLAQGEFTRFLNSKDSEKAQILEKITGASEYALIGAKVYEIFSQKKNAADVARQKIADIRILTEEELETFNARLDEIAGQKERLALSLAKARADKEWLTQRNTIEERIKVATKDAAETRSVLDSPEMVANRLTLSQWNTTSEARSALTAAESAHKELEGIELEYKSFAPQFAAILANKNQIEANRREKNAELMLIDEYIANESVNKSVYSSAPLISTLTEQIERQNNLRKTHEKNAIDLAEFLTNKLKPSLEDAVKEWENTATALKQATKLLVDGETALEALKIKSLRIEYDRLVQQKNDTSGALKSLRTWLSEHKRLEELKADIKHREENLAEIQKDYSESLAELNRLKGRRDSLKEVYDNQKNTVDKWAVAMRSHLHVGDCCPVCMQEITALPQQEVISKLLETAENAFREAECIYENFVAERNKLSAEIKVTTDGLCRDKKVASDRSLLNSLANDVSTQLRATFGADTSIPLSDVSVDTLKAKIADIDKTVSIFDVKLKEANATEDAVSEQRKKVDAIRTKLEIKQKHLDSLRTKMAETQAAHDQSLSLSRTALENITTNENKISAILKGSIYETDINNLTTLCKEIDANASKYNAATEQSQVIKSELSDFDKTLTNINSGIDGLIHLYAPLKEVIATSEPTDIKNPEEAIVRLRSHIQSASDRRAIAQNRKTDSENSLQVFLTTHPDIGLDRIKELQALTSQDINRINEVVTDAIERANECDTILRQLRNQLDELIGNEPAGIADTTIEDLTETITTYELRSRQLDESTGSIRQQLADNETNMKLRAAQIETVNRLVEQLSPWEKLNALIGDATGAKFRKIAQSYVLAALVHSANHYMTSLSDRYRLKVEPGTFIISIEDAYQGYISRPCTTISGGESFLVSLALALALSDIGDRVASDTIFIDEGFGSLSGEYLRKAIDTLRTLHSKAGRHVGIISHVEELREQIPVQITVNRDSHNSAATINIIG